MGAKKLRRSLSLLLALSLSFCPGVRAGQPSEPDAVPAQPTSAALEIDYLHIYTALNEAEKLESNGDLRGALAGYQDCYTRLDKIGDEHPLWESVLVSSRLEDCRAKIRKMQMEIATKDGVSAPPLLPVFDRHRSRNNSSTYPWKSGIHAKIFQINRPSSGNPLLSPYPRWNSSTGKEPLNSARNSPDWNSHLGYATSFYVALPFNDLGFPKEAAHWLPEGWARIDKAQPPISACQNRWVEIKNKNGRVCFAQWEAVGPAGRDDPLYVFGNMRPKSDETGIGISPAVAKYLNLAFAGGPVSWHFVANGDVRPGMWLRYDEQRILFRALHAQATNK